MPFPSALPWAVVAPANELSCPKFMDIDFVELIARAATFVPAIDV